jgi:hypothetical protein
MARSCVDRVQKGLGHVRQDRILSAELYGKALLAAKRPELQPLIDHIREATQARDDVRTECAGTTGEVKNTLRRDS